MWLLRRLGAICELDTAEVMTVDDYCLYRCQWRALATYVLFRQKPRGSFYRWLEHQANGIPASVSVLLYRRCCHHDATRARLAEFNMGKRPKAIHMPRRLFIKCIIHALLQ